MFCLYGIFGLVDWLHIYRHVIHAYGSPVIDMNILRVNFANYAKIYAGIQGNVQDMPVCTGFA